MPEVVERLIDRVGWNSPASLILSLLLAFVVPSYLLQTVGIRQPVALLVGVLASVGLAAFWLANRRIPKFAGDEIGLLVSFRCSGTISEQNEVKMALDALVDRLEIDAQSQELSPLRIAVKKLPAHFRVTDVEAARKIAKKSSSVCMIWSRGTAGSVGGDHTIDLGQINVLVRHKELPVGTESAFRSQLQLVHAADRRYQVSLQNDVVELPLISKNLAAISKYQIGLAFAVSGYREPAITLLKESLALDPDEVPHKRFARRVIATLRIAPWASRLPLPGDTGEAIETALREAEAAVQTDPRNGAAYSILVRVTTTLTQQS